MRRLARIAAALLLMTGFAQADPNFWKSEWPDTDFGTTVIDDWSEIMSGGARRAEPRRSP